MENPTEQIKGSCENCGFAFEGTIEMVEEKNLHGSIKLFGFPGIKCPKCHEETNNWDQAQDVEERDRHEDRVMKYTHVEKFEAIIR